MRARVLLVIGVLEAAVACGGGFSAEAPPTDEVGRISVVDVPN